MNRPCTTLVVVGVMFSDRRLDVNFESLRHVQNPNRVATFKGRRGRSGVETFRPLWQVALLCFAWLGLCTVALPPASSL
jgi:hypothetical protein